MTNVFRRKLFASLLLLILVVAGLSHKTANPRNEATPLFPESQLHLRYQAGVDSADSAPLLSIPVAPRAPETSSSRRLRIPMIQAVPRRPITDQADSGDTERDVPIVNVSPGTE
jgi:hypothetical protein